MRAYKDRIIAEQRIRQLEEEKKLLAAKSLVEGQEDERKRVARELHDGLGVLLSTAKMAFTTLKDPKPENKLLIDKATKLLEQASGDVRKISHNMMPGLLTKLGLYEALEDLFEKIDETESIEVSIDIPEDVQRLPENQEIMLYRIVQEMVNNTLKHAAATSIGITIQQVNGMLEIHYSDDGKGFEVERQLDKKTLGLTSIMSRVDFLNGTVDITSKPGKGMKFAIRIPVS
jgi:signal transduction histidine kinase